MRECVATIGDNGYMSYDLALHADFMICRDAYLDHFVEFCNVIDSGSKPSKYEYPENGKKSFKVWFSGIDFVLILLLIYET